MGEILEVFDEDLRRELAMKVISGRQRSSRAPSPATANEVDARLLTRFLEEAQITGQLDHPGVVPVHELGLGDNGEVFFTMQLVRGRDLEAIFDLVPEEREGWSMTRALGALLKACDAVAYAHSKGVVHRDLKPANIMVGHFGEVYVMDWGLARVANHEDRRDLRIRTARLEDPGAQDADALLTMDGDIIGTPAYMAPEQASGKVGVVDERTDVYAVGAMLYRLLAGTAPYLTTARKRRASELLRDLLEGPPARLENLAPRLPIELVAICEKAMARDPDDRYATMGELSEDLRAFLENRVVRAYSTGALAETYKWVRRNKPLATSLAALVLALVGGLAITWTLKQQADEQAALAETRRVAATDAAIEADAQRDRARRSSAEAEQQAAIAAAVNQFLNRDLLAAVAPEEQGIDITMREVLGRAAENLDDQFPDQPLVEAELRMTIGNTLFALGEYARSIPHVERAWRLRRETLGDDHLLTLQAMRRVAASMRQAGRYLDARTLFEAAVDRCRATLGDEAPDTLDARSDLALTLERMGLGDRACSLYREILDLQTQTLGRDDPTTLTTLNNLGVALQRRGKYEESEALLAEALERRQRVLGPRDPETLSTHSNYALVLADRADYEKSERLFDEFLDTTREVFGTDHPFYSVALQNLGSLYREQGRAEDAERVTAEAVDVARRSVGEQHPRYFSALDNLAVLYTQRGAYEEVADIRQRILAGQRDALGDDHPETLLSQSNLAMLYLETGRLDEAETTLRDALERMQAVLGPDHPDALTARENLGNVLFRKGDISGAAELTHDAFEGRRRTFGDDHPVVARTLLNLGFVRERAGETERALADFRESHRRYHEILGPLHPDTVMSAQSLAGALLSAGDFGAARATYQSVVDAFRNADHESDRLGYLLHQIAFCQLREDDLSGAIDTLEQAVEARRRHEGPDAANTLMTQSLLRDTLEKVKRYPEAAAVAIDLFERYERTAGPRHRDTRSARRRILQIHEAWGHPEKADEWR